MGIQIITTFITNIQPYETRIRVYSNQSAPYYPLYRCDCSLIVKRIRQHKEKYYPKSFTARYNLDKLVYYEAFQRIGDAIAREKQIKSWKREKKIALINGLNPEWKDLYAEVIEEFGEFDREH